MSARPGECAANLIVIAKDLGDDNLGEIFNAAASTLAGNGAAAADPANPQSGFATLMVCGKADAGCAFVKGSALRVWMRYTRSQDLRRRLAGIGEIRRAAGRYGAADARGHYARSPADRVAGYRNGKDPLRLWTKCRATHTQETDRQAACAAGMPGVQLARVRLFCLRQKQQETGVSRDRFANWECQALCGGLSRSLSVSCSLTLPQEG